MEYLKFFFSTLFIVLLVMLILTFCMVIGNSGKAIENLSNYYSDRITELTCKKFPKLDRCEIYKPCGE